MPNCGWAGQKGCPFLLHPEILIKWRVGWVTNSTEKSTQFRSVTQSCPTLCNPMNRSTPGLPVHHQLPKFTQIHIHRVSDAIQPSHPLSSPSPPAPNPSSIRVFSNESTLCMTGQSTGVSALTSVLPKNTQGFKGLSRVFSNTTVQKHQFFGAQVSSQSSSHIHT